MTYFMTKQLQSLHTIHGIDIWADHIHLHCITYIAFTRTLSLSYITYLPIILTELISTSEDLVN